MPDTESRRLVLYNGLNELLGPELADIPMTLLPATGDVATRADIVRLEDEMASIRTEMRDELRHLSQRIDRLQQTTLAGFVAMVAAVLAAGLLG